MNYDPIEFVLDLMIRRFGLRDWQYDVEDFVEDIAEGLRHIGAQKVFQDKVETVTVNNYAARIPKDCIHIKSLDPINTPYQESGSFITIDQADGTTVTFIYQAMPTDTRGYPLVPDNTAVREALMWYLIKWMILRGEYKTIGYEAAEQEWQWRCGSARADLNVMSLTQWNGVARNYTRLNPLKDQHEKNYADIGKPNTLDRDNKRQTIR